LSSSSTRALAPQASTAYERRALVTSSRSEPRGAAHARKHAYEYAHAHMHMHTCTCTHAHMHMHTCTCTLAWARVAPGGRPNFVGLIAFFWAQIARNFHLSDYCENKNETRTCLAIYLPVSTSTQQPPGAALNPFPAPGDGRTPPTRLSLEHLPPRPLTRFLA
jgi:hypothetical protein